MRRWQIQENDITLLPLIPTEETLGDLRRYLRPPAAQQDGAAPRKYWDDAELSRELIIESGSARASLQPTPTLQKDRALSQTSVRSAPPPASMSSSGWTRRLFPSRSRLWQPQKRISRTDSAASSTRSLRDRFLRRTRSVGVQRAELVEVRKSHRMPLHVESIATPSTLPRRSANARSRITTSTWSDKGSSLRYQAGMLQVCPDSAVTSRSTTLTTPASTRDSPFSSRPCALLPSGKASTPLSMSQPSCSVMPSESAVQSESQPQEDSLLMEIHRRSSDIISVSVAPVGYSRGTSPSLQATRRCTRSSTSLTSLCPTSGASRLSAVELPQAYSAVVSVSEHEGCMATRDVVPSDGASNRPVSASSHLSHAYSANGAFDEAGLASLDSLLAQCVAQREDLRNELKAAKREICELQHRVQAFCCQIRGFGCQASL